MHFTSQGKGEVAQTIDQGAYGSVPQITGSINRSIIAQLKQSTEKNRYLIFCPRALFIVMEDCLFFAGMFSGIYSLSIFSKVYLQILKTEKISFMQFIILTPSSRANLFRKTAAYRV